MGQALKSLDELLRIPAKTRGGDVTDSEHEATAAHLNTTQDLYEVERKQTNQIVVSRNQMDWNTLKGGEIKKKKTRTFKLVIYSEDIFSRREVEKDRVLWGEEESKTL